MKLRFYRFLEMIFTGPAVYFGVLADSIDTELHEHLRVAMQDNSRRILIGEEDDNQCS